MDNIITNKTGDSFIPIKIWYKEDSIVSDEDRDGVIRANDTVHREDGPAIIWEDGGLSWYLNNDNYKFSDWCKKLKLTKAQIVEIKLLYG